MSVWKPSVTVAAVIERQGRFLLIQERIGGRLVLNQPAGHLDPGESLVAACRREVHGRNRAPFRAHRAGRHLPLARSEAKTSPSCASPSAATSARRKTARSTRKSSPLHWLTPDEIKERKAEHRSPLVQKCVDDFLAGNSFPLDVFSRDFS